MRCSDIYAECARLTGLNDESLNFSRISDAVECLANKGIIDAMQGYVEIPTTSQRLVTLPRDVEVPISVNISHNPSFSRTKLYEFSMNGPGDQSSPTDWSWEDKGGVPTFVALPNTSTLKTISNVADNGKKIYIWGRDADNNPVSGNFTLNAASDPTANDLNAVALQFTTIDRVIKDVTTHTVTIYSTINPSPVLSIYAPDETEPNYRQIKLSKAAVTAHILFRRSVFRISTQNDWIPVQSRMGLFLMLKANELYRKSDPASLQMAEGLEKKAEQLATEEQKSRNAFAEVASQTQKDSARGKYFTNRDMLIVEDIYDEAAEIVGPIGQPRVFDRITEAVEALSNKAQWDSMTLYLDTTVLGGNVVVLPREVEVPLKININSNPSFARGRMYEFTLNGPGPDMTESTDFSWMDGGNVPTQGLVDTNTKVKCWALEDDDDGLSKGVTVYGKDASGIEVSERIRISKSNPDESDTVFSVITRIIKDATVGAVILRATTPQQESPNIPDIPAPPAGTPLAYYYPEEVEPSYRRIVLSKNAAAIRILFRKAGIRIAAMTDLIPLQSRAAVTCMMRSFEYYRSKEPGASQMAKASEEKAVALLQEEQKSRNVFAEFLAGDKASIIGLNINNRDSIIVSDIYDDVSDIVGPIGRPGVFDKITQAVEMLSRKGQWDGNGLEGYVDISSVEGVVTLPRYVDYVLAINIGTRPARMRNRWFEFHLNGPGSECSQSCSAWTDLGDVVTLSDLDEAQGLVYVTDSSSDNDKTVTVYGYDADDKWTSITVVGGSTKTFANITASKIKRIERVVRQATVSYAQLVAYNAGGTASTQLGYYYPDETEPSYRRIKVPCGTCYIRVRYRKRQLLISALTDPLHLKSRLAILSAVRSVEEMMGEKPNLQLAEAFEKKAVEYLSDEKLARNSGDSWHLSFDVNSSMASPEHAQY